MKTLPRSIATFLVALTVAALSGACSKTSTPSTNVDVSAKTEQLKSPDATVRAQAASELAAAGPKSAPAIPDLIAALKDSDPVVRRLSAYALGQIGPAAKEAIQPLTEALKVGDREMITSCLNALRAIDPSSVPAGNISNVQTPP
jgi:HEAT repeat protein